MVMMCTSGSGFHYGDAMRCLTLNDAKTALSSWLGEDGKPRRRESDMRCVRFYVGDESILKLYWIVLCLVEALGPWEEAWLWPDEPDTWNRQGLHLYVRLRQSYGELRLLSEAPVQQFYGFEQADLCSFTAIAVLNQWSFQIITSHDYARLFASRSSGIEVYFQEEGLRDAFVANLTQGGINVSTDLAEQSK